MTREEAKLEMLPPLIRSYLLKDDKKGRIDKTDEVIDEIYNDFESQKCENCKYSTLPSFCTEVDMPIWKDFGCNKFTRRKDD